jgi:heme exporter protein C
MNGLLKLLRGRRFGLIFLLLSAIMLLLAVSFIFAYAPTEKTMGDIQRIFYFHVPLAWGSFLAFTVVFAGSLLYLIKGAVIWDTLAYSSAQVGVIFNTLMLITGVIWAKAVWGLWWTWDARLTTSLVLWFIYVAYLLVRHFGFEKERGAKLAAVIAIIGFADVPVVAASIVLWQTLHPAALIFEGGLTPRMLVTLIISLMAFTLLYIALTRAAYSRHKMADLAAELESAASENSEED